MPVLPNSQLPQQNWADSATVEYKNSSQPNQGPRRPVPVLVWKSCHVQSSSNLWHEKFLEMFRNLALSKEGVRISDYLKRTFLQTVPQWNMKIQVNPTKVRGDQCLYWCGKAAMFRAPQTYGMTSFLKCSETLLCLGRG